MIVWMYTAQREALQPEQVRVACAMLGQHIFFFSVRAAVMAHIEQPLKSVSEYCVVLQLGGTPACASSLFAQMQVSAIIAKIRLSLRWFARL